MDRTDSAAPPQANPDLSRPGRRRGPVGVTGFVRDALLMAWRWLTRMRTALYLLGCLGLLTLLATVVPQEPNVPSTVAQWRDGEAGPGSAVAGLIDLVGGFDVYGSGLFLAFLLLLYFSLTACLIPRIRAWIRLVRRSQPPLLRHIGRSDLVVRFGTELGPDQVHEAARERLGERWRLRVHADDPPHDAAPQGAPAQIAAERGLWSREGGSLLFHVSFYVLLIAIVLGQLLTFEGQRGVVEGEAGFTDAPVSYWSYRPGRWFGEGDHAGWRLAVDRFHVDWVRDPRAPGAGQPTTFESDVTITPGDGGEPYTASIAGNEPLVVEGMKIHQLDWGYAIRVVVEVDGEVVHDGFVHARNEDGVFRGAVKAPAAEPDVGLDLFLLPYAPDGPDGIITTLAPWDDAPVLAFDQYRGDLQLGATQQTVNELDTSRLEMVAQSALRPGQQLEVEGVSVSFPELRRWVGFQVSTRPQVPWLLFGSGLLVAGLLPALYAYRRRVWVLASRRDGEGRTIVTVAGRAFQRPDTFEAEYERIVEELQDAVGGAPTEPSPEPPWDGPLGPDEDGDTPAPPAPDAPQTPDVPSDRDRGVTASRR